MSNTAALQTVHGVGIAQNERSGKLSSIATAVATVMFIVVIISLRPFHSADTSPEGTIGGGDPLHQIGYTVLACLSLIGMACLADSRRVMTLISPSWLILLAFVMLSTISAADPASSLRGMAFTFAAMTVVCAVLVLPRDGDAIACMIAVTCFVVLALNYAGVLFIPRFGIHSAAPPEPQHIGLWRGSFSHKNTAAPVMACLAYAGLYLCRRRWLLTGSVIFVAAVVFLINTGSKTTIALTSLPILVVMVPAIIGWRSATIAGYFLALVGVAIATLGIVFIPQVQSLAAQYFNEVTYTGRTEVWSFGGDMVLKRPWTGYGLGSFWTTPIVENTLPGFDAYWDIRGVGHGHNGYLDIALMLGLPALLAFLVVFVVAPARDYMRIPPRKENIFLGDLFMMILFFALLNSFLESYFFRRADPVWLLAVFGALGLRLVARLPYKSSWRGQR